MNSYVAFSLVTVAALAVSAAKARPDSPDGQQSPASLQETSSPAQSPAAIAAEEKFKQQDWPAAAQAYEALTAAHPKFAQAWLRLGYARQSLKQYGKAISAYRAGAEFPQVRSHCLYNIGCALTSTGDKDGAFRELNAAIDAGFKDLTQISTDDDLATLRDDPRFAVLKRRATPIGELVKEFDFWVGDWKVYTPGHVQVGTNRIEKAEGGCLIIENWSNMQGGTGRSINYVEPATREWRQVWVDPAGTVVNYTGVVRDGVMHFEGTYVPQFGPSARARGTLAPRPDGTVLHTIEHSTDGGATWSSYFLGVYEKHPPASERPGGSS